MLIENIALLEKLDYTKQLAFAYLTCERLYPNYIYFSKNFNFGDKATLREAINFIHRALLRSELSTDFLSEQEISTLLHNVDLNTPFPHNFATITASSALDACAVISETLEFLLDKNESRLNAISTCATDTVDMFVQERDDLDFNTDAGFEKKIFNDELMQREIHIQKGIIEYLSKIGRLELLDVNNLIELQHNNGRSNIDLD